MDISITRKNGEVVGLIYGVPDTVMFEGSIAISKKTRMFRDLGMFASRVKNLMEDGYIGDISPYFDFIFRTPSITHNHVDWERIPETTRNCMTDYQKDALETAIVKHCGCSMIALPPGSGKTLVGSVILRQYGSRYLILAPPNVCIHWQNEIERWSGLPRPSVLKNKAQRDIPSCLVASIETAKECQHLLSKTFDVIIFDECHLLKNDSKRTSQLTPLLKRAHARFLMSGTPIENNPGELFNQLHILHPDTFSSRQVFQERYLISTKNKWGRIEISGPQKKYLDELSYLMSTVWYRRSDIVVVQHSLTRKFPTLPPSEKDELILNEQKSTFAKLQVEQASAKTDAESERINMEIKVHINRMWQAAGQMKPSIFADQIRTWIKEDHKEEKFLFFVYHTQVGEQVKALLEEIGPTILIDGSTPMAKRDKMCEEFKQVTGGPRFAVMNIRAMGVGVNLTPGVSVVVFVELERSPSKMEQAENRLYRFGVARPVTSYWCILDKSFDHQTLEGVQKKRESTSVVLNGKKARFTID